MFRFQQWWRRQVRAGHGGLDVWTRFALNEFVPQIPQRPILGHRVSVGSLR